jgi:predicted GNAT family acetyltransferase
LWTRDELEERRALAEDLFRQERRNEGPRAFAETYRRFEPAVRHALAVTNDCRTITAQLFLDDPLLWVPLRYYCAPPISEEDLWTMVGKKFKRVPEDYAEDTASALIDVLDVVRLPWLEEGREPTEAEREAAVLATTQLVAYERLRTARRGQAAKVQEAFVAEQLRGIGFDLDMSRASVLALDDLGRGTFSRERKLYGEKCDLPVRLLDGRLLALECKVSNGPKNGWKRIHRDVIGKAEIWGSEFGRQVITGAVVAGAYDLSCLVKAQERGIFLFWQQDIASLLEFVTVASGR